MSPSRWMVLIVIPLALLVSACDPFYTVTVRNTTSDPVDVRLYNGRGISGDAGSRESVRVDPAQTASIGGVGGSAIGGFPNNVTVVARSQSGDLVFCAVTDHKKNYSTALEITQGTTDCPEL